MSNQTAVDGSPIIHFTSCIPVCRSAGSRNWLRSFKSVGTEIFCRAALCYSIHLQAAFTGCKSPVVITFLKRIYGGSPPPSKKKRFSTLFEKCKCSCKKQTLPSRKTQNKRLQTLYLETFKIFAVRPPEIFPIDKTQVSGAPLNL